MSTGGAPSAEALDERDVEPRTPMKRLGSTRKLAAFSTIRAQLAEQSRVLETRAEAAAGAAGELHEYCRRRAELEHEYARALDKLARGAQQRHREQRARRDHWPLAGAFACWTAALEHTRALARDHAALGALYGGVLAARLARAADDAARLHRKCRDVVAERHEELAAALADAGAAGKAHAHAAADWRAAATKLRHAHEQRAALAAHDPPRHKKLKALDKELEKRRARHSEARARGLRARADYVLSLEAANATLQRYYLDDIVDIMLCMEVGFEAVVGRAVRTAAAGERARAAAAGAAAGALLAAADALDALADRQRTLDAHAAAFALPRPLPAPPAPAAHDGEMRALLAGAAPDSDAAADAAAAELAQRLQHLEAGARQLRAECRESAKTLDAAEAELVRQMEGDDAQWEPAGAGAAAAADAEPPRRDQEDYYLHKFRSYVACAGRLARLEARAAAARGLLPAAEALPVAEASPPSPPRRAAARLRRGQFAAPLGRRLPAVLTSCVRVIASYGLHHQGVFRVSGSQVEMQALRAAFERGEDPLASVRDAADINSVCGLLKLYLRELRPPLLPPQLQESLLRVAAEPEDAEFARRLRATLAALPLPSLLVLRYLFAFLAHLAEHSERNMMDAWNLAICLGPTLLAAWGEGGAQVAAQNLVNELVKRTILHHEAVFPQDVAPDALYTRFDRDHEHAAPDEHEHEHDDRVDGLPSVDDLSLFDDDDDDASEDGDSGGSGERRADGRGPGRRAPPPQHAPDPTQPAPASAAAAAAVGGSRCASTDTAQRAAGAAPDLVLDLPARTPSAAPPAAPAPTTPPADAPLTPPAAKLDDDAADNFAHNRDTLKKRCVNRPSEPAPAASPAPAAAAASGSPVPARNTLRVAAQFAELTLTGGSKPAPAAKPALLRRPTPHPQHARPAAPPADAAPPAAPAAQL